MLRIAPTNRAVPYHIGGAQPVPFPPYTAGGGFTPNDISGCVLWADFSDATTLFTDAARTTPVTADGDVIGGVTDKSTAGTNHLTQSLTSPKPIYKVNIKNGLSVARFDAADDVLNLTNTILVTPSTLFIVSVKRAASGGYAGMVNTSEGFGYIYFDDASGIALLVGLGNQIGIGAIVGSLTDSFKVNTLRVADTNNAEVRMNGAQVGYDTNYATLPTVYNKIGQALNTSWGAKDILEVIAYDSRLSDTDTASVETYLNDKWAVY